MSHQWHQRLSEIKLAMLARLNDEERPNFLDQGTHVIWLNALTPYDVKFLKTLRIEP